LTFDHILEGHGAAIRRMVVTNDADSGPELWSSGEDGIIRVWSCANITAAPKLLEDHKHPIHTMVVSGSTVWSAGWETRIRVWSQKVSEVVMILFCWRLLTFPSVSQQTKSLLKRLDQQHTGSISDMVAVNSLVATGSYDKTLGFWEQ
jgi:WD40 repeat protein